MHWTQSLELHIDFLCHCEGQRKYILIFSLYFRRIWSIIVSSSKQKIVPVIESSSSDNFIIISSTYLFIIWKVSEIINSSVLLRFWLFLTRVGVRGVQQLQQCKQTGSDLIILIHLFRLILIRTSWWSILRKTCWFNFSDVCHCSTKRAASVDDSLCVWCCAGAADKCTAVLWTTTASHSFTRPLAAHWVELYHQPSLSVREERRECDSVWVCITLQLQAAGLLLLQ